MKSIAQMQTVQDYYKLAVQRLQDSAIFLGHGTEDIQDEAWWLITGALNLPIDGTDAEVFSHVLTPAELVHLDALLHQRVVERIPTAYLLREAYQNEQKFYVDERVLIPRSPIAELIDQRFSPWIAAGRVQHILDLCTGSGCLAILAAQAFPEAKVTGSDLSEAALEVAAINANSHGLNERLQLHHADLFKGLDGTKYDVILSNPPYVDAEDLAAMPAEYLHEPMLALAAGRDGLDIVRVILAQAKAYLNPHGILVVEVGNSMPALIAAYPNLPFIWLAFERGGDGVFLLKAEDL